MRKTTSKSGSGDLTYVPITVDTRPQLTEAERAELLASLKQAQAEIAAGHYVAFKPGELELWLLMQLADARRRQKSAR